MQLRPLGRSGLMVSAIGLGTMTWGLQNSEAEGHAQMDMALDLGVTFWDTAEMYAVPPSAETYGKTEAIIGSWLASRGGRDRIVLASKVAGPMDGGYIRGGANRLDRANITQALHDSLKRLGTDYIDLYQVHWPERAAPRFGRRGYQHKPEADGTPLEETLSALDDLVRAGLVRAIGVSNETPWGVMRYLTVAETRGLARICSIQNPHNLLNRTYEHGLAEIGLREDVGLLAYAPVAAGTLTGKYLDGAKPPGSRRAIDARRSRYETVNADAAVRAYLDVAARHGLDPAQMAIAFLLRQPFVASALVGATSLDQLRPAIGAADVVLSDAAVADIEAVHARYPDPCP